MRGYRSFKRRKQMAEINVVPYIDVMLVLLVIFMITAPLLTQGVDVDLPSAESNPMPEETEPMVVTVTVNGDMYIDEALRTAEEIQAHAAAVQRRNPEARFLVRGDQSAEYRHIVKAMVLLQQAGVPRVGMVTEPPEG
jgi:biopolymer transport protein TolR